MKIGRGAVANLIGYVTNRLDRVDLQVTLHMRCLSNNRTQCIKIAINVSFENMNYSFLKEIEVLKHFTIRKSGEIVKIGRYILNAI